MRLLDIIEDLGAEIIPVECDADGPSPTSLAKALQKNPTAFVFQPRTHSVTGRAVSRKRLVELAATLEASDCFIIEDDGVGDVSPCPQSASASCFQIGSYISCRSRNPSAQTCGSRFCRAR